MNGSPRLTLRLEIESLAGKTFSAEGLASYERWFDVRVGRFEDGWEEDGEKLLYEIRKHEDLLTSGDSEELTADIFQALQDAVATVTHYRTRFCRPDGDDDPSPISATP